MSKYFTPQLVGTISACLIAAGQGAELSNKNLSVVTDDAFPSIVSYTHKPSKSVINGQQKAAKSILLNGKEADYKVTSKSLDAATVEYKLTFAKEKITATLVFTLEEDSLLITMTEVDEQGDAKLHSLDFPENTLYQYKASQKNSSVAMTNRGKDREIIFALKDIVIGNNWRSSEQVPALGSCRYLFGTTGDLALGVASNHHTDTQRTAFAASGKGDDAEFRALMPQLAYREIDSETNEKPFVRVFLTSDRNGDDKATWQDAALVYRETMPKPFGHEETKKIVGQNIAMNFASGAQRPFLSMLDDIKRGYLATDGLEQQVLIKGFSAEGHDSANTDYSGHYNERAGGLRDLQVLTEESRAYNARIGFHINVSEVYPEAHRYDPEIIEMKDGVKKNGWKWLDQSYEIDKHHDMVKGDLQKSFIGMAKDLPDLEFIYVDTYHSNGWPAWKLADLHRSTGLRMGTENNSALDPWSIWAHARKEYGTITRFIWYSDRDIFSDNVLLRSGYGAGFMGWKNQHNFESYINSTFSIGLPSSYLRHYDLLSWEPGVEAIFSDGVVARIEGEEVVVSQDGRKVMSWDLEREKTRLLVPWNPITADKLYLWDKVGGTSSWELPDSWRKYDSVYLYQLTDTGRANEQKIAVNNGSITVSPDAAVPYVIYAKPAGKVRDMDFGTAAPLRDPGFDSYQLDHWSLTGNQANFKIVNDSKRNPQLNVGAEAGSASQKLRYLQGGKTYAASVWVNVSGDERKASITVTPKGGKPVSNYVTKTDVQMRVPNSKWSNTNFNRIKVIFDLPAGVDEATLSLAAEAGKDGSKVIFDEIRVVESGRSAQAAKHWFYEDFENVDMGCGVFEWWSGERSHLAEANPPYTKDVISGRFSLKTRERNNSTYARTLPATLRFAANTSYTLVCKTLTGEEATGKIEARDGKTVLASADIKSGANTVELTFTTKSEDAYLALTKLSGDWLSIDEVAIDEAK